MKCLYDFNIDCLRERCQSWPICKGQVLDIDNQEKITTLEKTISEIFSIVKEQSQQISKIEKEIKNVRKVRANKNKVDRQNK